MGVDGQKTVKTDLERIYQSGLKLLTALTLEETYTVLTEEAMKLVGAEYGSVLLEKSGKLERVYASDKTLYQIKARKEGRTYQAFYEQKASVYLVLPKNDPHPLRNKLGIKSVIYIPLSYENKIIGILTVLSKKEKAFNEPELKILQLFGSIASLSIGKVQMYDQARKALETRDTFISLVSNEISAPVATITNHINQLKSEIYGSKLPAKSFKALTVEALRLSQIVGELLEVDNARKGRLEYSWKECSVKEHIEEAIDQIKVLYPEYRIEFKSLLGRNKDYFLGDCDKIREVIISVLHNSIRLSPPHTLIEVTQKVVGRNILIIIKDHGQGLEETDMTRIFERFFNSQSPSKTNLGLGLYLTKCIIHQFHGSIEIHSKPKKGTTVEIQLPKIYYG